MYAYGAGIMIWNLPARPKTASAKVTITSGDGKVTTLQATRTPDANALEGSVNLSAPGVAPTTKFGSISDKDREAVGSPPYTYNVELELDGAKHSATARWPDDEDPEDGPRVRLAFSPPLPAIG